MAERRSEGKARRKAGACGEVDACVILLKKNIRMASQAIILDILNHFGGHLGVHPLFGRVADFLGNAVRGELAGGRHQNGSAGRFAPLSQYLAQSADAGHVERQRRHIDIPVIVSGVEEIGVCDRSDAVTVAWDEERDCEALECEVNFLSRGRGLTRFLPPFLRDSALAGPRVRPLRGPCP